MVSAPASASIEAASPGIWAPPQMSDGLANLSSQQTLLKDILVQYLQCKDPDDFFERTLNACLDCPDLMISQAALFLCGRWPDGYHHITALGLSSQETDRLVAACSDRNIANPPKGFGLLPIIVDHQTLGYLVFARSGPKLHADPRTGLHQSKFLSDIVDVLGTCISDMRNQATLTKQNVDLKAQLVKTQIQKAEFEHRAQSLSRLSRELGRDKIRAQDANNSKSTFLANMSHEVRSSLNGVLGMLSMLELSPLKKDDRECVRIANRATHFCLQLINDILDTSLMEAGKLTINPQDFSLRDFLASFKTQLSTKADAKGLAFIVNNELGDCTITGDELRLHQLLVNLTENAIKFTQRGQVQVTTSKDQHTGHICFAVEDTGQGIPDDKLAGIFERFEQINPSPLSHKDGLGLGLSICRNLVQLMDGTINVHSELDAGTCFAITLPLALSSPRQNQRVEISVDDLRICHEAKILAAEDNRHNREILRRLAKALCLDLTIVENGEEAFKEVTQGNYNIVLMDIEMPTMDGATATRAIRDAGSTIPIVAVSAHAMASEREHFMSAGMNGYVTKPYEIADLVAEIKRLTDDSGQAHQTSMIPTHRIARPTGHAQH